MRILVIEDDDEAAAFVAKGLREAGHVVDHALDGETGSNMAGAGDYDAYVIDRMLPKKDGLTLLTERRDGGDQTPALFLSALGEVDDRVKGLKAGGDDYLVKPYDFSELLARVEAMGRRQAAAPSASVTTRYQVGDLEIDVITRTVRRASKKIDLQPREFRLLEYLMRHAGQVVTRTMLLENVWEYHFDPQTNVIDVHISRLRSKIDKDFDKPLLKTIRGAGYTISDQD
ncbi:MAG: response regulator transcription factor [Pseudomonadota bacterium]